MARRIVMAVISSVFVAIVPQPGCASTAQCDAERSGHRRQAEIPPASLLQKQFHREAGELSIEQLCDGVVSDDRCWYLSAVGQTCDATCAAKGLLYSFAEPKHDMVPLLIGRSPQGVDNPWLHVECYVPTEDRYHPYNPQSGVSYAEEVKLGGAFSYQTCQLSCPCGLQSSPAATSPPSPIGWAPSVNSCTGIETDGRCWYLSQRGASCDATCAAHDCAYSFAHPSEEMVPKLIGHEPSGRLEPWEFLECFIAKEDLYHPASASIWQTATEADLLEAGKSSWEACRLSCPCAGSCSGPVVGTYVNPVPQPLPSESAAVAVCNGVRQDGACWYLSETGQNCDTTCAAKGSYYSFAAPSDDVIPKLVGRRPSARNTPWLFLECYVPNEDRYHPFNANAWGVPEKTPPEELPEAGQHTYPTCQLACPCAAASQPEVESGSSTGHWTHVSNQGGSGGTGYVTGVSDKPTGSSDTSPTVKPPTYYSNSWRSISSDNRSWFVSDIGESCASTCEKNSLKYLWAAAPQDRPMIPQLLGREPVIKQWPWSFVECYVPSEDRYHTTNVNAWGVPGKTPQAELAAAANWSNELCHLACPCATAEVVEAECGWVQPAACSPEFEYKGKLYTGCPMVDHDKPWCMHHHHHNGKEVYEYEWSNCIDTCGTGVPQPESQSKCYWKQAPTCVKQFDYEGALHVGCTTVDHDTPWCSNSDPYGGSWSHCSYHCDNPTEEDKQLMDSLNQLVQRDNLLCSWGPARECASTFTYKGFEYEGCAMYVDHPSPWCSHDQVHNGNWSKCEQYCREATGQA